MKALTIKVTDETHKKLLMEAGRRQLETGVQHHISSVIEEAINSFLGIKTTQKSEVNHLPTIPSKPRKKSEKGEEVLVMLKDGCSIKEIMDKVGVSRTTVFNYSKKLEG